MSQIAESKSHVSRITYHVSRVTHHVSRFLDPLIGLTLFLAGLFAYTSTLAPTVLEGDAALYQYTPYVLGVTYPTGYPFYILLGKFWLTLFPFGEVAWRMNLFSALCSATALPLLYGAARRLFNSFESVTQEDRSAKFPLLPTTYYLLPTTAALAAVLTFATLPTFWRWSTEAKIYSLNILLFSSVLYTLALAWEKQQCQPKQALDSSSHVQRSTFNVQRLTLPALLLGLQIAVHSTTVLLLPGLLLFVWLHFRPHLLNKKSLISNLLSLFLPPVLLYLYIPLRAEMLIAQYGRSEAIAHGLLADFYHSGLAGWIRYFTAADFTGGVVTNWGQVPRQFVITYIPILGDEVTLLGIALGLIGGLALAFTRPRLFWPLFLCYAAPIPFVLTYGQGEQSAFLLPSLLIFSIFLGYCFIFVNRLASYVLRLTLPSSRLMPFFPFILHPSAFILFFIFLFLPQIRYNLNWLQAKWDRSNYNYWADALAHPLGPGASLLAQWGDLTSFWYMQHVEDRRPDVRGLYPPTAETAAAYLQNDGELYMAGPASKAWITGIEGQTQLLPWGRLVRLASPKADPQTLLPTLPHPQTAVFDQKLRLLGADFPPQAVDGHPYGVTLTWQALTELPPETTISLRLSQGDVIAAQLDDALVSGWFPHPDLSAGQYLLSYVPIPIQLGTLPGKYRLQLVAYTSYKHPWPLADGATLLDLGEVDLTLPPAGTQPDNAPLNPSPGYDFNGEIELSDYEYTVTRVGQGKGFGVKLLWRAQTQPADNYTLLAELVDAGGAVLRSVQHQPVEGRTTTAGWQPGQFVRDQVDFVLPASAPVGLDTLRVRLSWLRPDGSRLQVRWWLLPLGESLALNWLDVTEKEDRVFAPPQLPFPVEANFDNKVKLLGYKTSLSSGSDLQWSQSACAADAACPIHFEVYWQGLSEMDQLYFVFLHLVDAQGRLVAQQDKGPGIRGKEPTTSWLSGEVIPDPIDLTLPPDLPPGPYTLRIGLYLPPTGPRLPVATGGDYAEMGTLEVIP